jgi:hypothetical protein
MIDAQRSRGSPGQAQGQHGTWWSFCTQTSSNHEATVVVMGHLDERVEAPVRAVPRCSRTPGVPTGRLHDAKHTAATVLLVLGVPERTVMNVMGPAVKNRPHGATPPALSAASAFRLG